jgi:hypothetical protein
LVGFVTAYASGMTPPPDEPSPYRVPNDPRRAAQSSGARLVALWFGLRARVSRRAYLASGVALMALKYGMDVALVFAVTGRVWRPYSYLVPSLVLREHDFGSAAPDWLFATLAALTLPFLWIGISMSVRRAAGAGLSPWTGLLFLVPLFNYAVMLLLAIKPDAHRHSALLDDAPPPSVAMDAGVKSALFAVLVNVAEALAMTAFAVYGLRTYGAVLFMVTPCAMGATSAFLYNRGHARGLGRTLLVALIGVIAAGGAILLFAMEGVFCLAMAFPIAAALAVLGALVGWAITTQTARPHARAAIVLFALPGAAGAEAKLVAPTLHEVETSIEIDAPPEAVWPNVIGFSELPPPPEWVFQLGIAYPQRARIDGEGVGAVRRCEFSTGPFVEPITRWEPPRRLSFDVRSQPPSMKEWSPYAHVNAPHLEGYMVSRRGEFRLIALPGGRTRLEGSTWYTLAIYPEAYWRGFGEALLHRIHGRVLEHIKHLSEQGRRAI